MANPLFSSTKIAGTRCTAAKFIAPCQSPPDVAPSPKKESAHLPHFRSLNASAMPTREYHHVREHRNHREDTEAMLPEVDVSLATSAHVARAPHVVAEDPARDPLYQVRPEVANHRTYGSSGPSGNVAPTETASWPRPS